MILFEFSFPSYLLIFCPRSGETKNERRFRWKIKIQRDSRFPHISNGSLSLLPACFSSLFSISTFPSNRGDRKTKGDFQLSLCFLMERKPRPIRPGLSFVLESEPPYFRCE